MFFNKKKNIINCTIQCLTRDIQYSIDENGYNQYLCQYSFKIIEPESLNYKVLYEYDENANLYDVDQIYEIKFNMDDGSFTIK